MRDPMDRWTRHSMRRTRVLVTEGQSAHRRVVARMALLFAVGIAALLAEDVAPRPWSILASGVVGAFIGVQASSALRTASAYRSGWLEGRSALVKTLGEADTHERGNALQAAVLHDCVHVLGLPVRVPDDPSDLD